MFGLFKKKTKRQQLNKKYDQLMKDYYDLSKVNRKAADQKYAEAEEVLKQIDQLPKVER